MFILIVGFLVFGADAGVGVDVADILWGPVGRS